MITRYVDDSYDLDITVKINSTPLDFGNIEEMRFNVYTDSESKTIVSTNWNVATSVVTFATAGVNAEIFNEVGTFKYSISALFLNGTTRTYGVDYMQLLAIV